MFATLYNLSWFFSLRFISGILHHLHSLASAWLTDQVPCQMNRKEYKITTCLAQSWNGIRPCSGHCNIYRCTRQPSSVLRLLKTFCWYCGYFYCNVCLWAILCSNICIYLCLYMLFRISGSTSKLYPRLICNAQICNVQLLTITPKFTIAHISRSDYKNFKFSVQWNLLSVSSQS